MDSPRNRTGLTFDEWCDLAGPGTPDEPIERRRAWRLCEDPMELRFEAEAAAKARAEKGDSVGSWIWISVIALGGIGLALIAFWGSP